jgi:uncharacterized protein
VDESDRSRSKLMEKNLHPCRTCGACCATFRVSFYWAEPVPEKYTEKLTDFYACMKGTNQAENKRCIALEGKLGEWANCAIYSERSSACRSFEASLENGVKNERCDRAREKHGLKPLIQKDWDLFHSFK